MTREEIADLLQRRVEAQQRHDIPALVAMHSEDCVLESPLAGRTVGHEAIGRVYGVWNQAFPDASFSFQQTLIDDDRAALVAEVHGTHVGSLFDLPPSGKPFTLPMIFLLTLREGCIVHERRIYDFTGLLVQLGMLKAKPAS